MKEIQYFTVLNDPDENQKMVRKLPRSICDRWGREVDRWSSMQEQENKVSRVGNFPYPPFSVFHDFLKREARIACNPVTMTRAEQEEGKIETSQPKISKFGGNVRKGSPGAKSFATGSEEIDRRREGGKKQPERCRLCKNDHNLDECDRFKKMNPAERIDFVKSNGLCLGCLRYGHMKKDCRGRKICATCKDFHPTSLHNDSPNVAKKDSQNKTTEAISHRLNAWDCRSSNACSSHSLIVPVWLHQKENPERKKMVYALLDDQSDACFVKDSILQQLNVTGPVVQLKLSTVQGESLVTCMKISNLVVRGVNEQAEVLLPGTYSKSEIPAKRCQIGIRHWLGPP